MDFLDIDWWSLALPFGYISVLAGMLYTFSTIYRKRKAGMYSLLFLCCVASRAAPAATARTRTDKGSVCSPTRQPRAMVRTSPAETGLLLPP